jgi:hypothetical protein
MASNRQQASGLVRLNFPGGVKTEVLIGALQNDDAEVVVLIFSTTSSTWL